MKWDDDNVEWSPQGPRAAAPVAVSATTHFDPQCAEGVDPDEYAVHHMKHCEDDDLSPFPPRRLLPGTKQHEGEVDYDADVNIDDDDESGRLPPNAEGREFLATKAFLGAIYPPSTFIRDPNNVHNVFDEKFNNWTAPEIDLELDYVMGYRARDSRYNLHYVSEKLVVFPAAAVGVVYNLEVKDEDFFFEHNDDIVSMDLHRAVPGRDGDCDLIASGSIGANRTCQLCIWEPRTLAVRHNISGFLQFGVMSVGFNPSATLVCAVGLDEHHSVALFSVATGLLMAHSAADKNRILHARFNLSNTLNSDENFVTVGVCHICFWGPADTAGKGANYFLTTDAELDKRFFWQRGNGIDNIDNIALMAVDFTTAHTVVGGTDGIIYLLDSVKKHTVTKVSLGTAPDKIYQIIQLRGPMADSSTKDVEILAVGTKEGSISFWEATTSSDLMNVTLTESTSMTADGSRINLNLCDKATNNNVEHMVNSVRSISWLEEKKWMAIGTILTSIYSLDVSKWTQEGPFAKGPQGSKWFRTLLIGHYGNMKDSNSYGEVWGIDSHPREQKVITCGDDCTVRLWDLDLAQEVKRKFVKYMAYKCSYSPNGELVAVGHRNGGFTIVSGDLKTILCPFQRNRHRCVCDILFSPNGKYFALASEQSIDIYTVENVVDPVTGLAEWKTPLLGTCKGHTSFVEGVDWNLESTIIQSISKGYDLLYFSIPDCAMITGVKALADQLWFTQTCAIGWGVQGIWPRYADGTDINSVAKSRSQKWLATTDDWGRVKLFNYPCVGGGFDRKTGRLNIRPEFKLYRGHSSHVTNSIWTFDDSYLCTTGGGDLSLFVWKVNYGTTKRPEHFLNADKVGFLRQGKKGLTAVAPTTQQSLGAMDTMSGDPLNNTCELLSANNCVMCSYQFVTDEEKACPRCMAPRVEPSKAKLRRAWNGETESRFRLPTQSFARYSREQQLQRKNVTEKVRPEVVWKAGNVKMTEAVHGASSDEEEIAKKLRSVKKTIAKTSAEPPSSDQTTPKTKAPKKAAGPDFRDY